MSAWLFVIFPFQSCPTRETAVDAAAPLAMPAQACRGFHQHVPGLVTVDAACPFAVAAADLFVSRMFLFCHSSQGSVGRHGVKHLQKGQEWRAVFSIHEHPGNHAGKKEEGANRRHPHKREQDLSARQLSTASTMAWSVFTRE